jgi:DNA repair exonuclease SbcCD ATPase subunit
MIIFKRLAYRNFLSTGDTFTEISLNRSRSTLVVGQNGAGKSTMLDALSFALFGKAHRNINKAQLVNSINGKGMVVEVEFDIGVSSYKLVRGVKPNKFEIWKDGTLVNQDSHNKEYQKVLEQNILKLNHKSFHQIVVLGSSSFIPFMQLPAQHRREVIEDLLDINVFSKMNGILKERVSILKEKDRANRVELDLINEKISTQQKYVKKLQDLNKSQKIERHKEITLLEEEINTLMLTKGTINEMSADPLKEQLDGLSQKVRELEKYDHQFGVKQKELNKEIKFYENNSTCPTCDQGIGEELKSQKVESATRKWDEMEEGRNVAAGKIQQFKERMDSVNKQIEEIQEKLNKEYEITVQIRQAQNRITKLQEELQAVEQETGSIEEATTQLEDYTSKMNALKDERMTLVDDGAYSAVITELLKDTGIKTKIIKQYLPVINNLVNKYLQVLDFFVSFHLDDTFKETIRSRHRDAFSYDSFSEGEKQRIDLALLFTWRQVAKMKNSVATNLLILDETFDSSLDADGVDNLTKILDTLTDDSNVFIISHKGELLDGKFDDKIEFVKSKNFSKVA